jgi:hypothetical protein
MMPTWLSGIFGVIGSVFTWLTKRHDANNTPAMVDRAKAQTEVKQDDDTAKTIRDRDTDGMRDSLS